MDVVVKSHHYEVREGFREFVAEKLSRVEKLDHRVLRCEVEVSKEPNPRQSDHAMRVELTLYSRGPVVRAEATAESKQAAFELALDRLRSQLRKAADRRRARQGGGRHAKSLHDALAGQADMDGAGPAGLGSVKRTATRSAGSGRADATPEADEAGGSDQAPEVQRIGRLTVSADGPMVVREKTHPAVPMSLDQALYEMELVGHDFYLFVDADHHAPSVVYRRRGYDYGVIRLSVPGGLAGEPGDQISSNVH